MKPFALDEKVVRAGGFAEAEALVTAGVARKAADVLAKALYAKTVEGEWGELEVFGGWKEAGRRGKGGCTLYQAWP